MKASCHINVSRQFYLFHVCICIRHTSIMKLREQPTTLIWDSLSYDI